MYTFEKFGMIFSPVEIAIVLFAMAGLIVCAIVYYQISHKKLVESYEENPIQQIQKAEYVLPSHDGSAIVKIEGKKLAGSITYDGNTPTGFISGGKFYSIVHFTESQLCAMTK